jgi:stage III sporulation protein AF
MWEMVRSWIVVVVAAIVLFSILDLLMPSGKIRKVAGMAAGLLILLMMLLPVAGALSSGNLQHEIRSLLEGGEMETRPLDTGNNFLQDDKWQVYRKNLIHIDDSKD